jgi:hypothetical protein
LVPNVLKASLEETAMTRLRCLALLVLPLVGCGGLDPVAEHTDPLGSIRVDDTGNDPGPRPHLPPVPRCAQLEVAATTGVPYRCGSDDTDIPQAFDLSSWTPLAICSPWHGHTGVIMPFCIDPTWVTDDPNDCALVEVFGVDLGPTVDNTNGTIIFHMVGTWAEEQLLETMPGSLSYRCGGNIGAGQASTGKPPKKPPQAGTGGGGSSTCVAPEIELDAYDRYHSCL